MSRDSKDQHSLPVSPAGEAVNAYTPRDPWTTSYSSAPTDAEWNQIKAAEQQTKEAAPLAPRPTVGDALKTVSLGDLTQVHKIPCGREGLLTGLGAGFVAGFGRYILRTPIPKAANWAVGTGIFAAMAQFEFCQYQRRAERENMKRVVEVVEKKQMENKAKEEAKKRHREEEAEAARIASQKRWYKLW